MHQPSVPLDVDPSPTNSLPATSQSERWPTFAEILQRLHQQRILIHPHQLAEFFLRHGLPVDLCYVPKHLQQKARQINANYQGDMARLEEIDDRDRLASLEQFF